MRHRYLRSALAVWCLVLAVVALLPSGDGLAQARSTGGPDVVEVTTTSFTFVNNTAQPVWVGALNNPGKPLPDGGGWRMDPGTSRTLDLPSDWAGRFWGRTGCTFDSAGNGVCETGDCAGRLQCGGAGGQTPATLAEITLGGGSSGGTDFYDVSLVDGFNLPVSFTAVGGTPDPNNPYWCTEAGCVADLNASCPQELRKTNGAGRVVGCYSACERFGTDQYCCRGAYGTPDTCKPAEWPVNYAAIFKQACPKAYSYAYDDAASTFTCRNCGYRIAFGPVSASSP